MQNSKVELVLDAQNAVGESPVWSPIEQALYWVDIPVRKIHRLAMVTQELSTWVCPEMTGCIAPHFLDGYWVVGAEKGIFKFTPKSNGEFSFEPIVSVSHSQEGMRFNDGRHDRQGRFLAGTMVMDMSLASAAGRLYGLDYGSQGATLVHHLSGFMTPNGMAFSPKGDTMYLSDSHPNSQKIWSFDYDTDSGEMSRQRLFLDMVNLPGRPDGAAVDTDGCYWICGNDAGLIYRITPTGIVDQTIALPIKKPAMCSFGGHNLDTLFVTSIRPSGVDVSDQPLAGGVFAIHTQAQGLLEVNHRSSQC